MGTVDGRHERHMMRQRGAGARSITTTFGFVFQAGPIQLANTVTDESSHITKAPTPTNLLPQQSPAPEPRISVHQVAPKRKRIVREDDDQVWFSKRSKKIITEHAPVSTTGDQVKPAASTNVVPSSPGDKNIPAPVVVDDRPARRKLVPQRSKAAKPPQKRPAKQDIQPASLPEDIQNEEPESKPTKKVAVAKSKFKKGIVKPAPPTPEDEDEDEDELSNDSLQSIHATKPTTSKARTATVPPKRSKAVPRKRTKIKQTEQEDEMVEPVLEKKTNRKTQDDEAPSENSKVPLSAVESQDKPKLAKAMNNSLEKPKTKLVKKIKVLRKDAKNTEEKQNPGTVVEPQGYMNEASQPLEKRRVAKKVAIAKVSPSHSTIGKSDLPVDTTPEEGTAHFVTTIETKTKGTKATIRQRARVMADVKSDEQANPMNFDTQPPSPKETTRQTQRLPLKERHSNLSPQKISADQGTQNPLEEQKRTRVRANKTKNKRVPETKAMALLEEPQVPLQVTTAKSARSGKKSKKTEVGVYEDGNMQSSQNIDMVLFDVQPPALITKEVFKPQQRSFNDESELDLDQMLDNIAAIATGGLAVPKPAKSSRVAMRKLGV